MVKRILFSLVLIAALQGCKKEHDRPQWDVNVIGPLLHASLGVSNFIADSLIHPDSLHAVSIVFEETIYNTKLDSLFQIRDTTIPTVVIMPVSLLLAPNTPFYSSNNNAALSISGVELRKVIIKSGFLHIETRNRLHTRVIYTYTIPKAKLNGNAFQFTAVMDAAQAGGFSEYAASYDMSGYTIDLTGAGGNQVNTLSYTIAARTDTGSVSTAATIGDTLINVQAGLQSIVPYYAKGYLGQKEINEGSTSKAINTFASIQSGNIRLEDVTMKFTIENSIGVDAQTIISQMQSVNTQTNSVVDLNAPLLVNHTININRASESGNPLYPVNPTHYVVQLDHTNSNLKPFIENLPDHLNYSLKLNVNPLGNISGSNDFVYSDYLVNAKIRVDMPLAFAADHLTLADTTALAIKNQADFDPVGAGTFTLIAVNGFPFDASVKLTLLDDHNQFLDSIPSSTTIAAAQVDANFKVIAPSRTLIPVYVDEARKQRILSGKAVSVRATFTTPAFPQYIQIYTDYKLDLKLVADAAYLIH